MKPLTRTIIKAGILAGTLDISAAFLHFYIVTGRNPLFVLQYIASGLAGKSAFESQAPMYLLGLLLHYCIAILFTLFFFFIYPKVGLLHKNKWITAVLYGSFVWCVMNLVIVPLSQIGTFPSKPSSIATSLLILILCIGLPLSVAANRYYKPQK
ncbi:hypothetical protein [Niabella soli]|uniref:DUF1440 domain-containing protein n=1 Tax=Niabella soli DSM 19437 TaxID=929713 RepID=W0F1V1_9BACT|nr:hypothetical protein [Niabella soli]AHF16987.1 hypothetical protein NIASO_20955 [Niabella soli DSM 19437]